MTHAFAPIQAYWQQRNARERTLLTACAVVVGLAAIYLIAEPIARDRARLQRSLPALRADAARFARDLAQAKGLGASSAPADIAALAGAAGLPPDQAHITSSDAKHGKLSGQNLPWPAVTRLLADARAQGWTLARLAARPKDNPATVDVDAEWTR
jgi:general secretion pathway protein M